MTEEDRNYAIEYWVKIVGENKRKAIENIFSPENMKKADEAKDFLLGKEK